MVFRCNRMQEAIDLVPAKKGTDGRWALENTFNGKFLIDVETMDSPSKWITLRALRVLKRLHHLAG
jgi:hypothetical protein